MTKETQTPNEHPEIAEVEWIDDCFRVYKTRFNLWHSASKDGTELVSSLTEEACIAMTRFYLKGKQEGWDGNDTKYDGTVGGKL